MIGALLQFQIKFAMIDFNSLSPWHLFCWLLGIYFPQNSGSNPYIPFYPVLPAPDSCSFVNIVTSTKFLHSIYNYSCQKATHPLRLVDLNIRKFMKVFAFLVGLRSAPPLALSRFQPHHILFGSVGLTCCQDYFDFPMHHIVLMYCLCCWDYNHKLSTNRLHARTTVKTQRCCNNCHGSMVGRMCDYSTDLGYCFISGFAIGVEFESKVHSCSRQDGLRNLGN